MRTERLFFLEQGNSKAGFQHVLDAHEMDFARQGISKAQLPDLIMKSVTEGRIVGYQGKGTGRPIYEVFFEGTTRRTAITTGSNGFIVGANPVSIP